MNFQPKKVFTPAEAKNTLPLVKKIVKDILDLSHEINALTTMAGENAAEHPQIAEKVASLKSYFLELENLGCYYKDWGFSIGLVDFPAMIDGELVFLCWRSDEEDIEYYHGIAAGYAGRKKLPPENDA